MIPATIYATTDTGPHGALLAVDCDLCGQPVIRDTSTDMDELAEALTGHHRYACTSDDADQARASEAAEEAADGRRDEA